MTRQGSAFGDSGLTLLPPPPRMVGRAVPFKNTLCWSSCCGSVEMKLTRIHEDVGLIPGLTRWVGDPALL